MFSKMHSFQDPRNPIGVLILLAAFAAAAGCSTANTPGGGGDVVVNHLDASGNSVPGWVTSTGGSHVNFATMNYIANGGSSSCTECHGSDLAGGISRVSCFGNPAGCHHGPIGDWISTSPPQNHGIAAKKAPGSSGFAACQICHGNNFSGGGAKVSCFPCHGVSAPHAPKPWRGAPYTHTDTDPKNAPVCAKCHFPGSPNNPANHPATPAPAGTAPGCFNNTLCHGENPVPHPVGNTWVTAPPAAQPHANDAKAAPGATTGFSYCQECHGTGTTSPANFGGGSSEVSCYPCHVVSAPHAPKPWRASAGSTYDHTNTDTANAPACAQCHFPGSPNNPPNHPLAPAPAGTAPGCFNSTLCHDTSFHPTGWAQATQHGPVAKQAPSTSSGFAFCQACHGTGTNFSGGIVGVSCYPCHGGVGTPHPSNWLPGDAFVHTSTAGGNATVCAFCHLNGANSPDPPPSPPAPAGTAPGCFNSTLCH